MKKIHLVFAVGILLAACSSEPASIPPLQLDYSSLGQINLNVQDVNVINRAVGTPMRAPYVGHMFKPQLADAVTRWSQDRLRAAGNVGHATVIIKEASVKEAPLNTTSGIEGWFTREQASKYIGRVEVDVEAQTPVNNTLGKASAHAAYAVTLPEKPTDVEKQEAYRAIVENIMRELNPKLEQAMRAHMAPFIVSSGSMSMIQPANINGAQPIPLPPATIAPALQPVIR